MPDFRRGAEVIQQAASKKSSGGGFRNFASSIYWGDDQEERYLLFLNPVEEIPQVEYINFIPVKGKKADGSEYTRYEDVIARTDPAIGESTDPLTADWDAKPRDTNIAVAVELEPVMTTVKGRSRPTGFAVKTVEFDRRVRDDEGELTDETETITAPVIGYVAQSPRNFFNIVVSYDANEAPITETPVKITRLGKDQNTTYQVVGYPDQEVDLSNLTDFIDGITYLDDETDEIVEKIDGLEPVEAAQVIGSIYLDKRLDELADEERYQDIYQGVTESLDRWGGGKKKESAKPSRNGSSNGGGKKSAASEDKLAALRQRVKRNESE